MPRVWEIYTWLNLARANTFSKIPFFVLFPIFMFCMFKGHKRQVHMKFADSYGNPVCYFGELTKYSPKGLHLCLRYFSAHCSHLALLIELQ